MSKCNARISTYGNINGNISFQNNNKHVCVVPDEVLQTPLLLDRGSLKQLKSIAVHVVPAHQFESKMLTNQIMCVYRMKH